MDTRVRPNYFGHTLTGDWGVYGYIRPPRPPAVPGAVLPRAVPCAGGVREGFGRAHTVAPRAPREYYGHRTAGLRSVVLAWLYPSLSYERVLGGGSPCAHRYIGLAQRTLCVPRGVGGAGYNVAHTCHRLQTNKARNYCDFEREGPERMLEM